MAKKSTAPRPATHRQPITDKKPQGLFAKTFFLLFIISLTALAAYANTFHVPFVFDDTSSIIENHVIKDLSAFLSGAGYAYQPRRFIGYLSFALNYKFGGLNVFGYHMVNLAIHISNGWLVYALASLTLRTPFFMGGEKREEKGDSTFSHLTPHSSLLPLLAALLFVAHPVQTQAVTYIVQRLASLATLFYVLSLVLYIKGRLAQESVANSENPFTLHPSQGFTVHRSPFTLHPSLYFILSLVSALLAMRTKEIAATLPLVIVLYEFSFFGSSTRKRLIFLMPLLLTIIIIPLGMLQAGKPLGELLSDVSEMTRDTHFISRGEYLLTQFSVIVTYIRLLFLPINQNLDYDYPIYDSLFAPRVFFSFLFLLTLFGTALYLYYRTSRDRGPGTGDQKMPYRSLIPDPRSRLIAFGILWFFITLAVESSIIPITDVIFEHRLYLPSVGAFIALAAAGALLFSRFPLRWYTAAIAALTLILVVVTLQRNACWQTPVAIWTDVMQKSPKKYRAYDNLGFELNKEGKPAEAIEYLQIALRINPDNPRAFNTLGSAYRKTGQKDLALEQFLAAVRLDPGLADAHSNLGAAYGEKGLIAQATEQLEIAVKLDPYDADAHANLGTAYAIAGLTDKAIDHLQSAVTLQPDTPDFHDNLANAYTAKGWLDKADKERERAGDVRN